MIKSIKAIMRQDREPYRVCLLYTSNRKEQP